MFLIIAHLYGYPVQPAPHKISLCEQAEQAPRQRRKMIKKGGANSKKYDSLGEYYICDEITREEFNEEWKLSGKPKGNRNASWNRDYRNSENQGTRKVCTLHDNRVMLSAIKNSGTLDREILLMAQVQIQEI